MKKLSLFSYICPTYFGSFRALPFGQNLLQQVPFWVTPSCSGYLKWHGLDPGTLPARPPARAGCSKLRAPRLSLHCIGSLAAKPYHTLPLSHSYAISRKNKLTFFIFQIYLPAFSCLLFVWSTLVCNFRWNPACCGISTSPLYAGSDHVQEFCNFGIFSVGMIPNRSINHNFGTCCCIKCL